MRGERRSLATGLGMLGVLYGAFIAWAAFGLLGGGHGWNSAMLSVPAGLVLLPLFGASLACQGSVRSRVLQFVLFGMLLTDGFLLVGACVEAPGVAKVCEAVPGSLLLWASLWFGWQLAAFGIQAWMSDRYD